MIIPKGHYDEAIQFRANGQWEEAVVAFTEAGDYSDAITQVSATYYLEGETKRNAGDWEGAVAAFRNAGEYSDAAKQVSETHYQYALVCMCTGEYQQAYQQFVQIRGYADVDTLLVSNEDLLTEAAARDARFAIGNYVTSERIRRQPKVTMKRPLNGWCWSARTRTHCC